MASERALAVRRALVLDRLAAHATRLSPAAPPPAWSKAPEIAAVERLEWMAALLDQAALPPALESAPAPKGKG